MVLTMTAETELASLEQLSFPDDFEEFRARAISGGSLFGLLRREAFARGSLKEKVRPERRPFVRQRSRSLIPRSVALPEDKSLLKVLCEYTESRQKPSDFESRRHSTACTADARDSTRTRSLSPVRFHTPPGPKSGGDCGEGGGARPKGLSLPHQENHNTLQLPEQAAPASLKPPESAGGLSPGGSPNLCRRRSFTLTPRGVVNEGDDLVNLPFTLGPGVFVENPGQDSLHFGVDRSRSNSCNSGGSNENSQCSGDAPVYRILMLGGPGVGKTALSQQFLTSEYMAAQNTSFDDCVECTVPVLLDGEESVMEFIDLPYTGDPDIWREYDVDGFVVVYSITDRRSYQKALDLVYDIQCSRKDSPITVILTANKSDLERSRMVGKQEGKLAADDNGCKHIEVSAILNHKVDDLLVGVLEQIRRIQSKKKGKKPRVARQESDEVNNMNCWSSPRATKDSIFTKLFKFPRGASRSCENLLNT